MKYFIGDITGLTLILMWIAGWVLAKGFWSTLFAVIIPPWALYLTVEHLMVLFKLI